jgi:hypothetical protein
MQTYKLVHVTGNTQSGGVQLGLFRLRYHASGGNRPPVIPAPRQAAKKMQKESQNIRNLAGR